MKFEINCPICEKLIILFLIFGLRCINCSKIGSQEVARAIRHCVLWIYMTTCILTYGRLKVLSVTFVQAGQNMFRSGRMTLCRAFCRAKGTGPTPACLCHYITLLWPHLPDVEGNYIPLHIIKMTMIVIFVPSCALPLLILATASTLRAPWCEPTLSTASNTLLYFL